MILGHIAHKPVAPNTLDRAAREMGAEGSIVKSDQMIQLWRQQIFARVIPHFTRFDRKFVPRTGRQAIIASIDPIAQKGTEFDFNRPVMFDR